MLTSRRLLPKIISYSDRTTNPKTVTVSVCPYQTFLTLKGTKTVQLSRSKFKILFSYRYAVFSLIVPIQVFQVCCTKWNMNKLSIIGARHFTEEERKRERERERGIHVIQNCHWDTIYKKVNT